MFIAGNHAVYVRDRDVQITEQRPLQDIAVDNKNNRDYVTSLVDCEFSYAVRKEVGDDFIIELSTLPFRENQRLEINFLLEINSSISEIIKLETGEKWIRVSQWSHEQ